MSTIPNPQEHPAMQVPTPNPHIILLNPPTLAPSKTTLSRGAVVEPPVRMVYCAGTVGADVNKVLADGFEAQLVLALQNVNHVLTAGGASIRDIVKLTFYVVGWDAGEMGFAFNKALTEFLTDDLGLYAPPRTLVGVACLAVPELLLEVDCVAATRV
jgi:enamine deaminase RidA (YjgF/YER057c/UK114 family)